MNPLNFNEKNKAFFGQNQYLIVSVCKQLQTTYLWISSNNKYWDTESWFAYSNYWFSKGHRLNNDLLLRTHQLYIVEFLVPIMFKCCNSVLVKGEGHSLQSLLLGVHTDVRLHLNTPQTQTQNQRHFSFPFTITLIHCITQKTLMVLRLLIRLNKLISKYFICLQITHWCYSYKYK